MSFNVEKVTSEIIDFVRDYYQKNNLGGAVIGISGGKDSAVCLALMSKAIGSENVLGLWLPADSRENDRLDAISLAQQFNIELKEFDVGKYANSFINDIKRIEQVDDTKLVDVNINLKPRLRMLTLYSYAALMTKLKKKEYLVIGTSNKSERFVGYFTKGGDNVCDIAPLADLYVDEIIKIGDYLKVPYNITHKIPDDGLSNISDEEKLGFSYNDVKKVAEEYERDIVDEQLDNEVRGKVLTKHYANLHKFSTPIYKRNN